MSSWVLSVVWILIPYTFRTTLLYNPVWEKHPPPPLVDCEFKFRGHIQTWSLLRPVELRHCLNRTCLTKWITRSGKETHHATIRNPWLAPLSLIGTAEVQDSTARTQAGQKWQVETFARKHPDDALDCYKNSLRQRALWCGRCVSHYIWCKHKTAFVKKWTGLMGAWILLQPKSKRAYFWMASKN